MPDAINLDALSLKAYLRVLELREQYECLSCHKIIGDVYEHELSYCDGPFTSVSAVYVKRRGNGWQVGTVDGSGWALVLG